MFFARAAAKHVFSEHVCSGLKPPKRRATPPSSSPSSSAVPASCPSSPPSPKTKGPVSTTSSSLPFTYLISFSYSHIFTIFLGLFTALFQSLLFEAAGRTVNPVNGAVGLLWTGNWHVCQAAVETVLRGGALKPIPELLGGASDPDDASECTEMFALQDPTPKSQKRRRSPDGPAKVMQLADLDLSLTPRFQGKKMSNSPFPEKRRLGSPSMNSEESETTTCGDGPPSTDIKVLNLFT